MNNIKNNIYIFVLINLISNIFLGCASDIKIERVEEKLSPDKSNKYILTKNSYGGATGSYVYKLYLVENYKDNEHLDLDSLNPLLTAEKVNYLNLEWESNNLILINISSQRIYQYKNFWFSKDFGQTVGIVLREN